MPKKKKNYVKVLYKGHVIQNGDIVMTSSSRPELRGAFRVVRVWGHHATLEPYASAVDKNAVALTVDIDITA